MSTISTTTYLQRPNAHPNNNIEAANNDNEEEVVPLIHNNNTMTDDNMTPQTLGDGIYLLPQFQQPKTTTPNRKRELPKSVKLVIGAGGVYASMLYVGSLQEDVFSYVAADGSMFDQAWFLQLAESGAYLLVGFFGVLSMGLTTHLPLRMFWFAGVGQVMAKACSNLALAHGLPYPIVMLAKSCKMVPVMIGSLLMGGASFQIREYTQVMAIITGTMLVMSSRQQQQQHASRRTTTDEMVVNDDMSTMGMLYLLMGLVSDGVVAGFQRRLQSEAAQAGLKPTAADFLFWTSVPMTLTAGVVSATNGDFASGVEFCWENPSLRGKIVRFALCSAVGQCFIFYTLAEFNPLTVSAVTTTRKILSVLLSIFLKGHALSEMGWAGVVLASMGILSELDAKRQKSASRTGPDKKLSSFRAPSGGMG